MGALLLVLVAMPPLLPCCRRAAAQPCLLCTVAAGHCERAAGAVLCGGDHPQARVPAVPPGGAVRGGGCVRGLLGPAALGLGGRVAALGGSGGQAGRRCSVGVRRRAALVRLSATGLGLPILASVPPPLPLHSRCPPCLVGPHDRPPARPAHPRTSAFTMCAHAHASPSCPPWPARSGGGGIQREPAGQGPDRGGADHWCAGAEGGGGGRGRACP